MASSPSIHKMFRATLLLFATTFGIGLYALLGAPILRIDYGELISKTTHTIAGVGESALKSVPLPHLLPEYGSIKFPLTLAANDLSLLQSMIKNSDFGTSTPREIVFKQKNQNVNGGELLSHFAETPVDDTLKRILGTASYAVHFKDEFLGTIIISTPGNELTYAGALRSEAALLEATLPLVHPEMSAGEIRQSSKSFFISRSLKNLDVRELLNSKGETILAWGATNHKLIFAGNEEDFLTATSRP